ncbi:hypothetical protein PAXRUDRAFT_143796, partial [Paxillus rubicundulus Ve08.2h10]
VVVFVSSPDGPGETAVHIKALPVPLQFDEVATKSIEAGKHTTCMGTQRREDFMHPTGIPSPPL